MACRNVFLFTNERRTYALISFADSDNTFGLFLVISDEEYEAHSIMFLQTSGEGARRSAGVEGSPRLF